jgi:D-alanine-D-alanine ligase
MKIAVIHGAVAAGADPDEQDVLVQAAAVSEGLTALGHEPVTVPVTLDLEAAAQRLANLHVDLAFNLVESLGGRGCLIHLVPSLLDALGIPYTGASAEAMMLTSNKLLAKQWLAASGLPTPRWITASEMQEASKISGPWLIKSVWEHASIGLDEDSVVMDAHWKVLQAEMERRCGKLGGACFAEAYIDGREFNLSLLAGGGSLGCAEVLPAAEIRFDAYPPGKARVVGYRSKWQEDSFEYHHTPRSFVFPGSDAALLERLGELTLACWRLFRLRGHARVDFRVDPTGQPWILEVNANPCLSPDAGFAAAAREAGLSLAEALRRIIADANGRK